MYLNKLLKFNIHNIYAIFTSYENDIMLIVNC